MLIFLLLFCSCNALNLNQAGEGLDGVNVVGPHTSAQYIDKAYMPSTGPFTDKFRQKASLTENIWASVQGATFNPSIVALPNTLKTALDEKDAEFAAAFRHRNSQCGNLGNNSETKERGRNVSSQSSLILLNRFFQPITTVRIDFDIGQDVKLFFHNDELVVNYMTYDGYPEWHMHTLQLAKKPSGKLVAYKGKASDAFANVPSSEIKHKDKGRNFGILDHENQTYILWWADAKSADADPVRTRVPDHAYHLSGNPLHIPKEGMYLAILHTHAQRGLHKAKYGSEYLHYFLLLEDQPPFAPKGLSAPFCLPSIDQAHSGECEVVQFISSFIVDPHDPQTLLIAYGVNDCESAITHLPFEVALKSARDHKLTTGSQRNIRIDEFASMAATD